MAQIFHKRNSEVRHDLFKSVDELDLDEVKCGIGRFTPNWLQKLARKEVYLVVFCISSIVLGSVSSYSIATFSTIEKRFQLSSNEAGIILIANDIANLFFTMIFSYYGNYGNRPKMMAISFFASGIFSFMCASPHFLFGFQRGEVSLNIDNSTNLHMDLCIEDSGDICLNHESYNNHNLAALIILFLGQFFFGAASTSFYAIGFVYLDDNVAKGDSPIYYAISLLLKICGPISGFILGSIFLSMNINVLEETNLVPSDPQWIGAWWFGYLFVSILLIMCGTIIGFFPITLPDCLKSRLHEVQLKRIKDNDGIQEVDVHAYMDSLKEKQRHVKPSLKNMVLALKRICTNQVWMGYIFHMVLSITGLVSAGTFDPKYFEDQFKISASESTFVMGVSGFVSSVIGFMSSGLLIRKYRPGPKFLIGVSLLLGGIQSVGAIFTYFVQCPYLPEVIGPSYWPESLGACDAACDCGNKYTPVCSQETLQTFYSACYAGCQTVDDTVYPPVYGNCLCVPSKNVLNTSYTGLDTEYTEDPILYGLGNGEVTFGACDIDCRPYFQLYMSLKIILNSIGACCLVGRFFVALRSLETHDKGIALGLNTTLMSLFAFIPVPIFMGKIIDTSCLVWDNTCGSSGNCWLYDSDLFRLLIHVIPSSLSIISMLGDVVMFKYCKGISLYDEKK